MHWFLNIHVKCENCTFDEIKFYIQLVIVQLRSFSSESKVFNTREVEFLIRLLECGVGMGWDSLSHTKEETEPLKDCVPQNPSGRQ